MNLTKDDLAAARQMIEGGDSFVIAVHPRPDSDCIGSALALARGLRHIGKRVVVISQDPVPDTCAYLPDAHTVVSSTDERGFDVGIICDADGPGRIGSAKDVVLSSKSILVIDHHEWDPSTPLPAVQGRYFRLADQSAAATAEIIPMVLHEIDVAMDRDTARQLMAGLVGDTGGFRFANVTSQTLEVAARLTSLGGTPAEAIREIYENRSLVNVRLLAVALFGLQLSDDGISWSCITQKDYAEYNATDADTESIVNVVRDVRGVKVGILFREVEPNRVQVSLRSRDGIDVNVVARKFGGGGHAPAAGCTLTASLNEAVESVLAEVRACMAS